MNSLNTDLQKINYQLDMDVNMEKSIFQRIFDGISNSDLYKSEFFSSSFQHNIYHIQRVMLFSQIIAQNECIGENDLKLLLLAAGLHDSGKIRDRKDFEHEKNSAKIAKKYVLDNISSISEEDIKIIQIAVEHHTVQETEKGKVNVIELENLCQNYNVSMTNFGRIKEIASILKDADALDRKSFKYIINESEEKQNIDFFMENNPNEKYGAKPPIYGKIFNDIINGKISISVLEELRDAVTELNNITNEEYMKKINPYINMLDISKKQKDLIYNNILLRKKNISNVFKVLKIKLYKKCPNNEIEL